MNNTSRTIFVTGGAGFIGANFLRIVVPRYPDRTFVNVDALTYAGNLESLTEIAELSNYRFEQCDLRSETATRDIFKRHRPDAIVHFAAESHVDRSILGPRAFVETNILGTYNLLECAREQWRDSQETLFHHVSTDEVYGSLGDTGKFTETTAYDPSSPYSASKAASDHLVRAYARTYGLNTRITNCSNNYGPYQFPEKLIPLMVLSALDEKPLPIYGAGANVRDWLYVEDHCEAILAVIERGRSGETYNIGGDTERRNIDIVDLVCRLVAEETGQEVERLLALKTFVPDRPGHDLRYAVDTTKVRSELGWSPRETLETGLKRTVRWYIDNQEWVRHVRSGEYRHWMERNYGDRLEIGGSG